MTEIVKLPARVQQIVDRCANGQRLVKGFRHKESGDVEIEFYFEPSGRRAGPKSALAAIESGLLRPLGDGLLGEESSQTWGAACESVSA